MTDGSKKILYSITIERKTFQSSEVAMVSAEIASRCGDSLRAVFFAISTRAWSVCEWLTHFIRDPFVGHDSFGNWVGPSRELCGTVRFHLGCERWQWQRIHHSVRPSDSAHHFDQSKKIIFKQVSKNYTSLFLNKMLVSNTSQFEEASGIEFCPL